MKRPKNYRPRIPLDVQLAALYVAEGLPPDAVGLAVDVARRARLLGYVLRACLAHRFGWEPVECDHDPALVLRAWNSRKGDTVPPANDPAYLVWRPKAQHATKTFGIGGESRITTKGSDIATAHALVRLREAQEAHRTAMRAKRPRARPKRPKPASARPWPSRKLPSRPLRRAP